MEAPQREKMMAGKKEREDYFRLNMPEEAEDLLHQFWAQGGWTWDGLALWLKKTFTDGDVEEFFEALRRNGLATGFRP